MKTPTLLNSGANDFTVKTPTLLYIEEAYLALQWSQLPCFTLEKPTLLYSGDTDLAYSGETYLALQ